MNILHLHPGPDTGGTSVGAKRVLEAAGDSVRVFTKAPHPFGYPPGESWDDAEVDAAIDWCDVVIVHNYPWLWNRVARGRLKPLVLHHHGSHFRHYAHQTYADAASLGAVQVVSTVDLLTSVPRGGVAYWMPQCIDLPKMAAIRTGSGWEPGRVPRVTHAPTNRQIKGTRTLERGVRMLDGAVELKVIRNASWEECLRRKARSDIYWDQLHLGYGNNALEAWAMGLPVIAGADSETLDRMCAEYGGPPPFYPTTQRTVAEDLRAMGRSADLRAEWAARGMEHIQRFHAPEAFVARAHDIYDRAIRPVAYPRAVA